MALTRFNEAAAFRCGIHIAIFMFFMRKRGFNEAAAFRCGIRSTSCWTDQTPTGLQ